MKMLAWIALVGAFGLSVGSRVLTAQVVDLPATRGIEVVSAVNLLEKNMKVDGTLFIPERVGHIRAVIVVMNYGLGAREVYADQRWRRLSETLESCLFHLGITTISGDSAGEIRRDAALGGAQGVVMLMERLARESGHAELTQAPLLFWGHSSSGPFGGTFAVVHPERTIGFVRYHSGGFAADLNVVRHIPGLFISGGKDTMAGVPGAEVFWKTGRAVGAPWTFVVEPNAEHQRTSDVQKANDFMIAWVTAVVRQRVSADTIALRVVPDGTGWLGNLQTGDVASDHEFSGPKAEASWLPDEATAREWRIVRSSTK